ncbi:type II secretion system protein [Serpentinicella sp. ANB-PHB4]|uniref:type IV pilus modification PilV family protein n=1 Tax=Serpentinicella sp. ANB-PHB4 TaxID=3074076 RepID=UPI002858700B|nr:type II secretion system protein [Serpentinicella sp. ANB-PHB4]MDR5658208.1 type II secretion system protein [Serpentinicella sp. ANB-PHB4]
MKIKEEKGIILIEVIGALLILSIMFTATFTLLAQSIQFKQLSDQQYKNIKIAQGVMEELKATNFFYEEDPVDLTTYDYNINIIDFVVNEKIEDKPYYNVTMIIKDNLNQPETILHRKSVLLNHLDKSDFYYKEFKIKPEDFEQLQLQYKAFKFER